MRFSFHTLHLKILHTLTPNQIIDFQNSSEGSDDEFDGNDRFFLLCLTRKKNFYIECLCKVKSIK